MSEVVGGAGEDRGMNESIESARIASIAERVGESLVVDFGGFLRCETCGSEKALTPDAARGYMGAGWPTCCGYTMRWWTQRQINAGEVP